MKKIFFGILAMAAFAACSNEEQIAAPQGEAIAFGNAFVDNSVRADYSTDDIEEFLVYGTVNNVNIFSGDKVEKTDDYGKAWSCDKTQYWIEDAAYKFAALVDVPNTSVAKDGNGMPVSFTYTADGVTDVLYNYVEKVGQPKGQNSVVGFTFKHLLAKVYFTVTNGTNDPTYTYTISNVKVNGTYPSATYNVYTSTAVDAVGDWDNFATASSTDFATIADVEYGTPKKNAELLLIPEAEVSVSFDVTLSIGGKEVVTYSYDSAALATPVKVTLAQNCVYNFKVELAPNDPIQFTVVEQPDWVTPEGGATVTPAN